MKQQTIEVNQIQGLAKTLQLMNYLEQLSLNNQSFVSFVKSQFDLPCQSCIPGKVWAYIRQNFLYKDDDPYDEILTAPYLMNEIRQGDCDDFSLYAKTILDILGFHTNYVLLGKDKNEYTHIVVLCYGSDHRSGPIIVDGANPIFNKINNQYKYSKIIK